MKKGFTLIELVGVIIILGVIAAITIPIVDKSIKESKETLYNAQIENIIESAKAWMSDNAVGMPYELSSFTLTLGELQDDGYADKDIENPRTGGYFGRSTTIVVTNENGSLKYEVYG